MVKGANLLRFEWKITSPLLGKGEQNMTPLKRKMKKKEKKKRAIEIIGDLNIDFIS